MKDLIDCLEGKPLKVVFDGKPKPLKVVFEDDSGKPITVVIEGNSNGHVEFEKESFKKLTERVMATSDDNTCRLYLADERGQLHLTKERG